MGRFQKGQPRPKGAGRKPGSRNLFTRTVKDAFEAAFEKLQSDPKTELACWARRSKANLRHFYTLAARFIPLVEINTQISPSVGNEVDRDWMLLETARAIGYVFKLADDAANRDGRPLLALAPTVAREDGTETPAQAAGPAVETVLPAPLQVTAPSETLQGVEGFAPQVIEQDAEDRRREEALAAARAQGDRLAEQEIAAEIRRRETLGPSRTRNTRASLTAAYTGPRPGRTWRR
ncbi:MAG: hypothetical protein HY323_01055 [Betaproteobacteria bacterium]|nr:hypothetical protein [Betaproteobacteria bacterium]